MFSRKTWCYSSDKNLRESAAFYEIIRICRALRCPGRFSLECPISCPSHFPSPSSSSALWSVRPSDVHPPPPSSNFPGDRFSISADAAAASATTETSWLEGLMHDVQKHHVGIFYPLVFIQMCSLTATHLCRISLWRPPPSYP